MLVQIYGLTTPHDAREVDRLGPDMIGIVVDEGIPTWDSVEEEVAREITSEVRGARIVALSLSTDPDRILLTVRALDADVLHLARAVAITPATLDRLRDLVAPVQLMLTAPVEGAESVLAAQRLATFADYLLLDTVHPETGVIGASGHTHNWALSAEIVATVDVPVILAGGLGPHNVREAIAQVQPAGVDSETRTSRDDDRRRKDLSKVASFITLARSAFP